jgi:apolipoprotein N-acyltransferase
MVHHQRRYYNGITVVGEGDGTVPQAETGAVWRIRAAAGHAARADRVLRPADVGLCPRPGRPAMLQAKGYQIAPFICYEVVYPEFAAGLAAQSDLLLTISNDTWFGTSIGPLQHLQMAQMRALEAGRWMIRATNNGVTGLINPFGQITAQIPQFERGILYGEVVPMHN